MSEPVVIYDGDHTYIRLTLTAINEGTETAYNAKFDLALQSNTVYIPKEETSKYITYIDNGIIEGDRRVTILYQGKIVAGDMVKFDLFFETLIGRKDIDDDDDDAQIDFDDWDDWDDWESSTAEMTVKTARLAAT